MPNDIADILPEPGFRARDWQIQGPPAPVFGNKPEVKRSEDLERVVQIPRRPSLDPATPRAAAMVELVTARLARPNAACQCHLIPPGRDCITRLLPVQAAALYEIGLVGGLLGPIGVGHGKTVLDVLAALVVPECKTAVLLIPPELVDQFVLDYQHIGQHFLVPSLVVHGRTWTNIVPNAPVLHVFPYSRLSLATSTDALERMRPDTIIADEAHKLRHLDGAGASRVARYLAAHPSVRFICWSGSITDASVTDYGHLSYFALRAGSPLPADKEVIKEWASALDPVEWPAPPGALLELCNPGEHVYDGFHRRLVETLGVVHTTTSAVDAELCIEERVAPALPPHLATMIADVRTSKIRPDGEELVDPLSVSRCCRELACGFYYRWRFPHVNGRPQSASHIEEWFEIRKTWHKELRLKLEDREEHLDSPLLCYRAAARAWGFDMELERATADEDEEAIAAAIEHARLPAWKAHNYPAWRAIRDTVVYETEAVRVDDYLVQDASRWAHENRGIVWYLEKEFGAWVGEVSGLTVHGGGPNAGRLIAAERGERSICCSIQSHGTGRNGLQLLYHTQLVASPPSSPTRWEQLLGRLHRLKQKSPIVYAYFYRHTPELRKFVDTALARALYVQSTLGSAQKLRTGFRLET